MVQSLYIMTNYKTDASLNNNFFFYIRMCTKNYIFLLIIESYTRIVLANYNFIDLPNNNIKCSEALPGWDIRDPEFNQEEMLAVWRVSPKLKQDGTIKEDGKIHITPIDMETGNFFLLGQSEISNANPVPQKSVINGPEWANSQRGWEIFYSCYSADFKTVRLCKLDRYQNSWRVSALPSSKHKGMRTPSKNVLDPVPNLY